MKPLKRCKRAVKALNAPYKMPKPDRPYGHSGKQVQKILDDLKIEPCDFWKQFGVNTVAVEKDGTYNYYTCDIERTLFNVTYGMKGKYHEWD